MTIDIYRFSPLPIKCVDCNILSMKDDSKNEDERLLYFTPQDPSVCMLHMSAYPFPEPPVYKGKNASTPCLAASSVQSVWYSYKRPNYTFFTTPFSVNTHSFSPKTLTPSPPTTNTLLPFAPHPTALPLTALLSPSSHFFSFFSHACTTTPSLPTNPKNCPE